MSSGKDSLLWLKIGVLCAPEDHKVIVPRNVTAQEGLCVLIPCEFTYEDVMKRAESPHGYWYIEGGGEEAVASNDKGKKIPKETRGRFKLVGDLRKINCSLSINDIRKSDGRAYYFKYENSNITLNYSLFPVHVDVVDLQEKPDIFGLQNLTEGKEAQVYCRAPGRCSGNPPNITWNTDSELEYLQKNYFVDKTKSHMSRIIFNVTSKDKNKLLSCTAHFSTVNASTTNISSLNIQYPPTAPKIRLFMIDEGDSMSTHNATSMVIGEGVTYIILCIVDSNPPANLTWLKSEHILEESTTLTTSNNLQLSLLHVTSKDVGTYRCEAVNKQGKSESSVDFTAQSSESTGAINEGKGCDPLLSIGALAGIMAAILLMVLLLVGVSFCVIKTIRKRSKVGEKNMKEASDIIDMDSAYQELQGQQIDIYSELKKE